MEKKQKDLISPELIRQAKAGDQAAFSELYRLTSTELYRSIRSMVREEDLAWDILQDSYLRAWKGLSNLREDQSLLPWLRRIAVNVTADTMAQRRPLCFTDLTGEADTEPVIPDLRVENQPELALDRKETARLVGEILSQLPEGQQMILGMHYYEGMSVKEIADTLKLSPNTVKVQMHRGRKGVETRVRQLEAQGVKLYGFSPLPFLLALLRRLEPLPAQEKKALGTLLTQTQPTASAAVTTVTATAVGQGFLHTALGKAAIGLLVLGLVGGGLKLGYDRLLQPQPIVGPVRFVNESAEDISTTEQEDLQIRNPELTQPPTGNPETQAPTEAVVTQPRQENPTPDNRPGPTPGQPNPPVEPNQPTQPTQPTQPAQPDQPPAPVQTEPTREESGSLLQGSYQGMDWSLDLIEKRLELDAAGSLDLGQLDRGSGLRDQLLDPETRSQYQPYLQDLERVTLHIGDRVTRLTGLMTLLQSQEITTVELPASLTSLELEEVGHCSLASFQVAAGNPNYSSDSQGLLYNKDKTRLLRCPPSCAANLSLPAGLTAMDPGAFRGCVYLKQLSLPASLQTLSPRAFQDCVSLESVDLPAGLQTLPESCFEGCKNLEQVQLPQSLTAIEDRACYGCEALQGYGLPEGLVRIGTEAFAKTGVSFTSLSLRLPSTLTLLGPRAFENSGLSYVYLPANLRAIPEGAFRNCHYLIQVQIPEGLQSIEREAFLNCWLTWLWVPGSVTRIGSYAIGYYSENAEYLLHELVLKGPAGSEVERYALENGIPFTADS